MDIKFNTEEGTFSVRVRAVIINGDRLLAMRDEFVPYYYLVGGKVKFDETAQSAILREVAEELHIRAKAVRPLFVSENMYNDDISGKRFHEIAFYWLLDISLTDLLSRGDRFTVTKGEHTLTFEWLDVNGLKEKYLYPSFIKKRASNLPDELEFITERE